MKILTLSHCIFLALIFSCAFSELDILSPQKLKDWWDTNPDGKFFSSELNLD